MHYHDQVLRNQYDLGDCVVVFRFILQNVICLYRRYLYIVMTGRQSHNIDNNNYGLFLPQTFSKIREDYQQSGRIIKNFEIFFLIFKTILNSES